MLDAATPLALRRSAVGVLFLLLFVVPLAGTELRSMTTAEAARLARRIVVAECRAVDVREADGQIFTFTDFDAITTVKGTLPPQFTLRLVGGQVGDVTVDAPLTPRFVPGERLVLFLGADNKKGYPVIFPQAVFRVRTRPGTTEKIVAPKPTGLVLYRASDGRAYPTPLPADVLLEDLVFSLRKLQ